MILVGEGYRAGAPAQVGLLVVVVQAGPLGRVRAAQVGPVGEIQVGQLLEVARRAQVVAQGVRADVEAGLSTI